MILAIISDIHDNLVNLEKCLVWCKENKIEKIICLGDITNSETLNYLSNNFNGDIFLVRGNIELYDEDELEVYNNINYEGETKILKIDNLNIGLCHEPQKIKKLQAENEKGGDSNAKNKNLDFIFYGHTHKPWLEKDGATMIVNPGNLSGTFHEATFAYLDTTTRKLELKVLKEL